MTTIASTRRAVFSSRQPSCRWRRLAGLSCIVLAMVVLSACGTTESTTQNNTAAHDALKGSIKANRYQAVILTNDRVYFGHLKALGNGWYQLTDAFFIRQVTDSKANTATQKVTRVGDELQQPESTVMLNRDNIVQVENLSQNSRVAAAMVALAP